MLSELPDHLQEEQQETWPQAVFPKAGPSQKTVTAALGPKKHIVEKIIYKPKPADQQKIEEEVTESCRDVLTTFTQRLAAGPTQAAALAGEINDSYAIKQIVSRRVGAANTNDWTQLATLFLSKIVKTRMATQPEEEPPAKRQKK